MGNLNINRNLVFSNPNEVHGLKPEKIQKLEESLKTSQSDLIFETPEGGIERLTVDEFLGKAEQLQSKGTAHLTVQLPDGRSVVVALANLSRETLDKALEDAVKNANPAIAKELQSSAASLLSQIRTPTTVKPIQRLDPGTDFVQLKDNEIAAIKAQSGVLGPLLEKVGFGSQDLMTSLTLLLKEGGEVDQAIGKMNTEITALNQNRMDFLALVETARKAGKTEVNFKGQNYSLPQGAAEYLEKTGKAIQAQVDAKGKIFEAVQNWKDQIPSSLWQDLKDTTGNFAQNIYDAYKSRAGVGDSSAHGNIGTSIVTGEAAKAASATAKAAQILKASSTASKIYKGLINPTAQAIAAFMIKHGGGTLTAEHVAFINKLVGGGTGLAGKALGGLFDFVIKVMDTTAPEALAKVIGKEGAENAVKSLANLFMKVGGKMGAKGAEAIISRLSLGNVLAGYSAAYYSANALGLNYVDDSVDGTPYKMRLSADTSLACGAAGIMNGLVVATSVPPGSPWNLGFTIGGIAAELLAEYMIAEDKKVLTDVHRNIIMAKDGDSLRKGLDALQKQYGDLANIQSILGQTGDGKDLVGVVLRQILKFGGELPSELLNKAVGDIIRGVDTRWLSDDNAIMGFLKESLEPEVQKELSLLSFNDSKAMVSALQKSKALTGLFDKLSDANRLQMLKILNEGVKVVDETAMIEMLYRSAKSPKLKGQMTAELLNSFITRSVHGASDRLKDLIWQNLTEARAQGPEKFKEFLNAVQLNGKNAVPDFIERMDNQKSGQLLAWMIQAGAGHDQFKGYVERLSSKRYEDDNITREFLKELQALDISVGSLRSVLGQEMVQKLFDNLESCWTSGEEYGLIEKLAEAADASTKTYMINQLLSGATYARAEKAIVTLLAKSSPEERKHIVKNLDLTRLGSELESAGRAAKMMNFIYNLDLPQAELSEKLNQFFGGVKAQGLFVNTRDDDTAMKFLKGLNETAVANLDEGLKRKLFDSLDEYWTSASEYGTIGKLAQGASADTQIYMLNKLMTWPTLADAQNTIKEIISQASPENRKLIAQSLDLSRLGSKLGKTEDAAKIMNVLATLDLPTTEMNKQLQAFFTGVTNQNYIWPDTSSDDVAYAFLKALSEEGLKKLPDDFRIRLFKNLDTGNTATEEYDMMVKVMKNASNTTKADMIKYLMNQDPTTAAQEKVIYQILEQTPYSDNLYLDLIGKIDLKQLANEMENDAEAGKIAVWLLKAYEKTGNNSISGKCEEYLLALAEKGRSPAIRSFLQDAEVQADNKALFRKLNPSTLQTVCSKLMDGVGWVSGGDLQKLTYELINASSWKQFGDFMDAPFREKLESKLTSAQFKEIQQWYWDLPKHL